MSHRIPGRTDDENTPKHILSLSYKKENSLRHFYREVSPKGERIILAPDRLDNMEATGRKTTEQPRGLCGNPPRETSVPSVHSVLQINPRIRTTCFYLANKSRVKVSRRLGKGKENIQW